MIPGPSASATRVSTPTTGAGYASLCLLGVLRACAPRGLSLVPSALPFGPGGPSSWTNITPPAGGANPSPRVLAAMTYYPTGHEVVLFGGATNGVPFYENDTWAFAGGTWTELVANSSCTATTCPSPRADVMLAYDAPLQGLVLFGGELSFLGYTVDYNDTWLFSGGSWHNITGGAGGAPAARFGGAMTWDALDNQVLLFGGSTASGTVLGDTWAFNGTWHNITATVLARSNSTVPSARAGMAIAASPSGYLLMYGGEAGGNVLWDNPSAGCYPLPVVGWWFYQDRWSPMRYASPCVYLPRGSTPSVAPDPITNPPPCGREDPALGWSPKNERFVLYGGYGPLYNSSAFCSGPPTYLNDTWLYGNAPGASFYWQNVSDAGDPSYRYGASSAPDYTDNYFVVFGGASSTQIFNSTYRFFALVHARLTGPSDIDTNSSHLTFRTPFEVSGYGGSGSLDFQFALQGKLTTNSLVDGGSTSCANLTNPATVFGPLPLDGINDVPCVPAPQSYNIYRLTVHLYDAQNATDAAWANWTFRVDPPETMVIHSQFSGYFYSGITFPNKLTVVAQAAGMDASALTVTLGNAPVPFNQRSGAGQDWDSTPNMGLFGYGPQTLLATATFAGGWVLNTSLPVNIVETPDWLQSILVFPQIMQTVTPHGTGPYNESYSVTEAFQWSLDKALGFNIQLPFVKGNVSLIPSIQVSLTATSSGNLTLSGSLGLTPPSIDLGPVTLGITVTATLKGTFTLGTVGGQITGVTWDSATASITVAGKVGASVPIYGFNILGVKVGFTLEVEVDPSVTLGVMLAPTTPGFDEFIPGIAVKVQQFFATLSLQLQVAVNFGIGIASIGIGGSVSVAVGFAVTKVTSSVIYLTGGWLNGTIFVEASFLWWSDQWNLASGTIYSWTNPPPSLPLGADPRGAGLGGATLASYNNGTNTTWTSANRSYLGTGYDQNVWRAAESVGQAIADIYPHTEVSVAASADGAYAFFTDDNASRPASSALTVSALRLDGSTNVLASLPPPPDPNFVIANPKASTLPDGRVLVLWDAVPAGESSAASPSALTSVALHGAVYDPSNRTWGAVRAYTSSGFAQSFAVDPTGAGTVAVLVAGSWLPGPTDSERLLDLDLASGTVRANSTVTGLAEVVGVRGSLGEGIVRDVGGNYTAVDLTTGAPTPIGYTAPIGGTIVSAGFVAGASSTTVLLDRASNRSVLALYDLSAHQTIASLALPEEVNQAEAITSGTATYVFVRSSHGIEGWNESVGSFSNLTTISQPGVTSYTVSQDGSGVLLAYLVSADRSGAGASVALDLAIVGATLATPPSPSRSGGSPNSGGASSGPSYALYLVGAAAGVVVLLAVVAVVTRRRPPAAPTNPAPSSPPNAPTEGTSEGKPGGPPG